MKEDFRHCPLCNGEVDVLTAEPVLHMQLKAHATVCCPVCQLRMTRYGVTAGEAVNKLKVAWNRQGGRK